MVGSRNGLAPCSPRMREGTASQGRMPCRGPSRFCFRICFLPVQSPLRNRPPTGGRGRGRAAERVEKRKSAPYIGVAIGGKHFTHVKCEPAPDKAADVATKIGEKYWSDVMIRHSPPPPTCRLVPE